MLGEISAFGASLLWSISPYVFTNVVIRTGSYLLNTFRLFISLILMFFTIVGFRLPFISNVSQILYLSISGLIGLVLGDTFLFKSFDKIGPRITMIVMASNPIFGAILAYFLFAEIISPLGIIGMLITISGIIIVVSESNRKNGKLKISTIGLFYALMATIGQAVGLIFTKMAYFSGSLHPIIATFLRVISAFITLIIIGFLFGKLNYEKLKASFNTKTIAMLTLGSLIGPYLGITLSYIAISFAPIGIASTIMSLQPILMLPISKYYYKEHIGIYALIGSMLAVLGLVLLFMRDTF
ncbi:MAG: DMT family transporter [Candidatus Kapaibacteriales bacterium]